MKIDRFAKLWGCDRDEILNPDSSKIEHKILYNKEITKYREEIKLLKRRTKKVLFAYAKVDQEIGYVQGMNSIASAIVYNLFVAEKELKKNRAAKKNDKIFGAEKAP